MTKISRYTIDTDVSGSDKWIGSDAEFYNATKNFTPDKVARYFNENQVIDTGANLRMRYVVLDVGEERPFGSITFNPQQGATVPFSSISNFLMSDKNTAGALVPNFIEFLQDTKVFISKTRDLNTFGYYKVISVEEYLPEPDFYTVTVEFISGNGSLTKDVNYVISFVSDMSDNGPIYTFTSPLVNTSDVISIGQSSSTEDGYLSSVDWNVFNDKQEALSGNGFVKVSGSTITYDNTTYFPFPLGTISEYVRGDGSIGSFPSLDGYVPYVGATDKVDLGTNDLYVNKVFLYDAPNDNHGSIHFTDGNFHIEDVDGHPLFVVEDGFLQIHKSATIQSNLFTTDLTAIRDHYLPDESGTIALTSDIPAPITIDAVPTDGSSNAVSSNGVFDALATKQNVITNPITGTGANGQVAFWNGTNSQTGDNGLFWDNTNKRLGVGTNAPATTIDVNGTIKANIFRGDALNNGANTVTLIQFSGTGNRLFDSSGNQVANIRNTNFGIGVGTAIPGARLDVRAQGALSTDIAFRVRNSTDSADLFTLRGNGAVNINVSAQIATLTVLNTTRVGSVTGIDASAQLDVQSTTKGFLPPRMTNAQRLAIASPAVGLMVYCTDATEGLYINKSTGWQFII